MAEETEGTFKAYFDGAMTARRKGAWGVAKRHFLEAGAVMVRLGQKALTPEKRAKCEGLAVQMKAAAADCDAAAAEGRKVEPEGAKAGSAPPVNVEAMPAVASISRSTCDHLEKNAKAAEDRREWDAASHLFLEASRAFEELSRLPDQATLTEVLLMRADMLRKRALACESKKRGGGQATRQSGGGNRGSGGGGGGGNGGGNNGETETSAEQWMVKEKPSIRFDDVAGLEDVKDDIRLKLIYPFQQPELAKKFGVRLGGGILFYGPPGTGKTMLAKATAGEVDATFFRVSSADLLSKWVGEAEQNIKKLFDAAANEKRAIIFIDEIEALIPARRDEGGGVMQRVIPQILQGMEGFDKKGDNAVLFLGATNVPWQLDPAVLRPGRFDDKVYIPLPDLPARRKLLDLYLAKRPVAKEIDFDALANKLAGFSGADIKYICDRSATIPFLRSVRGGNDSEITQAVVDDVIATAPRSVTADMLKRFEQWAAASANS